MRIFNMLVVLLVGSLFLSGCSTAIFKSDARIAEEKKETAERRRYAEYVTACRTYTTHYENVLCKKIYRLDAGEIFRSTDHRKVVYTHSKDGTNLTEALVVNLDAPSQWDVSNSNDPLPTEHPPSYEKETEVIGVDVLGRPIERISECTVLQGYERKGEKINYSRFCFYSFKLGTVTVDYFEQLLNTKLFVQWTLFEPPMTLERAQELTARKQRKYDLWKSPYK